MVGKKTPGPTMKKSPVASELALANRPRRNISPKNLDLSAGLSWREERELKKALYASLQESKKCPSATKLDTSPIPLTRRSHGNSVTTHTVTSHTVTRRQSPRASKPITSNSVTSVSSSTVSSPAVSSVSDVKISKNRSAVTPDDSSQDSVQSAQTSSSTDDSKSKLKVRAQRKFAQMMAYGNSMTPSQMTPVKQTNKTSPIKVFPKRAKTEDFLTFLCLRGTQVLPPHLDFFNFSRDDGDSSCPATPSNGGHPGSSTRESSPSSSSSCISHMDFDSLLGRVTPNRKAARACAGTPETARGLASIGRGSKSQNGSPLISKKRRPNRSPAVTPSKSTRSLTSGSPQKLSPIKRGKSISPSKTTASDRLAIKKKALATLRGSKMSPIRKQERKKSLFQDTGSNTRSMDSKKKIKLKKLKKADVKYLKKTEKPTKSEKAGAKKTNTTYIADRLPKRQAKLRGYRYFLDEDEIDPDVLCLRDSPVEGYRQRSPNRKRKSDNELETRQSEKIPMKKARIQKVEKKSDKAKSHGKFLLRQLKSIKSKHKKQQISQGLANKSSGVHTRSGSRPDDSESNLPYSSSSNKNSKLKPISSSVRIRQKKSFAKDMKRQKVFRVKKESSEDMHEGIIFTTIRSKNSVLDSAQKKKRKSPGKSKIKAESEPKDVKLEPFPSPSEPARIVEAPVFYPTEEEFSSPVHYIQCISSIAESYGMCRIVPPVSWKPDGKISDEMRFTTQKQYVHQMFQRYGPNVRQYKMIRKHLESHGISEPVPVIGGVEIDLCKLSAIIEDFGGMQNVIERKKWLKVADVMGISRSAQDRGTRLYEAYCKFLVSYDTLSDEEKLQLEDKVEEERGMVEDFEDEDDCIVKGKNMPLPTFVRMSRNIASMWLKEDTSSPETVEREYWRILQERSNHVVAHSGKVDTQNHHCSLFASKKDSQCYKHPWNLNNLPKNSLSMLKYIPAIPDVTVPTLHVGMPFTTSCWSTDLHALPFIQYLHSEADTVWYSIPQHEEEKFKTAMTSLAPTLVSDGLQWLRPDTVMVPPDALTMNDVSVSRCVQRPGQFVVVFPRCFTANISCGYTLSESVHCSSPHWLQYAVDAAKELYSCHEKELFSMDELLCRTLEDPIATREFLLPAIPAFQHIVDEELKLRQQLSDAGLKSSRKMCTPATLAQTSRRPSCDVEEIVSICDISKKICYLSLVLNEPEDIAFSLEHGLAHIQKKRNIKACKLLYRHTEDELKKIISAAKERLHTLETPAPNISPRRKQPRKLEQKN